MTAIPHGGVSARRLAGAVVRPRIGARVVRPSSRQSSANSPTAAPAVAGSAQATAPQVGVAAIPSLLGLRHLRFVLAGRRVRMGNGAFVLTVLGLLTAMLGALLFLNTALAETSFQITNIRTDMRDLSVREQVLSSDLAAAESPIGLEKQARAMGLVPAGSPLFLRLADGKVLGSQTPAEATSPLDVPQGYETPKSAGETQAELVTGGQSAGTGEFGNSGETAVKPSTTGHSDSGGETSLGIKSSEAAR